jgi:hypothetical protein
VDETASLGGWSFSIERMEQRNRYWVERFISTTLEEAKSCPEGGSIALNKEWN